MFSQLVEIFGTRKGTLIGAHKKSCVSPDDTKIIQYLREIPKEVVEEHLTPFFDNRSWQTMSSLNWVWFGLYSHTQNLSTSYLSKIEGQKHFLRLSKVVQVKILHSMVNFFVNLHSLSSTFLATLVTLRKDNCVKDLTVLLNFSSGTASRAKKGTLLLTAFPKVQNLSVFLPETTNIKYTLLERSQPSVGTVSLYLGDFNQLKYFCLDGKDWKLLLEANEINIFISYESINTSCVNLKEYFSSLLRNHVKTCRKINLILTRRHVPSKGYLEKYDLCFIYNKENMLYNSFESVMQQEESLVKKKKIQVWKSKFLYLGDQENEDVMQIWKEQELYRFDFDRVSTASLLQSETQKPSYKNISFTPSFRLYGDLCNWKARFTLRDPRWKQIQLLQQSCTWYAKIKGCSKSLLNASIRTQWLFTTHLDAEHYQRGDVWSNKTCLYITGNQRSHLSCKHFDFDPTLSKSSSDESPVSIAIIGTPFLPETSAYLKMEEENQRKRWPISLNFLALITLVFDFPDLDHVVLVLQGHDQHNQSRFLQTLMLERKRRGLKCLELYLQGTWQASTIYKFLFFLMQDPRSMKIERLAVYGEYLSTGNTFSFTRQGDQLLLEPKFSDTICSQQQGRKLQNESIIRTREQNNVISFQTNLQLDFSFLRLLDPIHSYTTNLNLPCHTIRECIQPFCKNVNTNFTIKSLKLYRKEISDTGFTRLYACTPTTMLDQNDLEYTNISRPNKRQKIGKVSINTRVKKEAELSEVGKE